MPESIHENSSTRLAHVLFMDIVGYSKLAIDEQAQVSGKLKAIVRATADVTRRTSEEELITLFTGDGLALVFFDSPLTPVKCAAEISRELKLDGEVKLRMGVHSGLVELIHDVNDKLNVAGGGINTAQRVMDCGDDGHILLSGRVANDLRQFSHWRPMLHDLGETKVKHDATARIFNFYSDEIGNSVLPAKFQKRSVTLKKVAIVLLAMAAAVSAAMLVRYAMQPKNKTETAPLRTEEELTATLRRKQSAWVERAFSMQAADGGIKTSPAAEDNTVQAWSTSQTIVGVLEAGKDIDAHIPKIKKAFEYIESKRRIKPTPGWNLYGGSKDEFTITEIGAWITVAEIKSLESKTPIWTEAERQQMLTRIERDLDATKERQNENGGFRPIIDNRPEFTRTYSTVIALWSLLEARRTPVVHERIGDKYDETIRRGINWLLRTYKEKIGWLQNPNRTGQINRLDGLTAQALFVLSIAADIDVFSSYGHESVYSQAKSEFVRNKQFAAWSIETDNSNMSDGDLRFPGTEFLAEGSTFLWFPWTLAALTKLSSDAGLSQNDRTEAAKLRSDILQANYERLDTFVETANYSYVLAENLFCVSSYLDESGKTK